MKNKHAAILIVSLWLLISMVGYAFSFERRSRYATLQYDSKEILREFNDALSLGRSLSRMLRTTAVVTVEDEAIGKIDVVIEKAETVLDMFPDNLHIRVVLLPRARDVAKMYALKYGKSVDHIAYYSLSEKTVYLSVNDVNLEVFSHEIGHAVVDHYFDVRPPYHIHELMAQFTSKHIQD